MSLYIRTDANNTAAEAMKLSGQINLYTYIYRNMYLYIYISDIYLYLYVHVLI
jgi:hypothetical protein